MQCILTLVSLNDMFGCLLPREKIIIFFQHISLTCSQCNQLFHSQIQMFDYLTIKYRHAFYIDGGFKLIIHLGAYYLSHQSSHFTTK